MKKELILPSFSLGWELEATQGARRPLTGIEVGHDGSVGGEALEYRTSRKIVFDSTASLAALRCLATDPHLQTNESCGFHVHIGLGRESKIIYKWAAAFVALARHVEKEAFEAVPRSRTGNCYAKSWKGSRASVIQKEYRPDKHACEDRYNWVNPVEVFRPYGIRTVEIRLLGDTHHYGYLLAWISFCRLMAMSAWALAVEADFSREQEEIDHLKEVLTVIRDSFQRPCASKTQAKNTVILAHKARLLHPYGQVLTSIKDTEDNILYEAMLLEKDRASFEKVIKEMRDYVRRTQAEPREEHGGFRVGDTVECIALPRDGGCTLGRRYRVIHVGARALQILNDSGNEWFVNFGTMRRVARLESEGVPCAV
jgi:hypothetical protein